MVSDERNVLHVGRPGQEGRTKITPGMAGAVLRRIEGAGGKLIVWAILQEDSYETRFGDGLYLHVRGIALNNKVAQALVALAGNSGWVKWHVKDYALGVENGRPTFLRSWPKSEEFTIAEFVEILSEIAIDKTASNLCVGTGSYGHGPFVSLPE